MVATRSASSSSTTAKDSGEPDTPGACSGQLRVFCGLCRGETRQALQGPGVCRGKGHTHRFPRINPGIRHASHLTPTLGMHLGDKISVP